ncbi:DUF4339 domain-containing protein [Blastopirellula marina]|uniref:GYF domain-containing protein n=1 Tax=Blastopirellula marina TaxID=124 RepID=A0A2S8G9D2_9BACT|nr:DUF4339 domain-containing protein [Blastopirellula marina]PQO41037.1 hypothetical protein C5Y98_03480 [Blastopirellula marina]PTL45913.1 DUF4339 domain-containing protein [Blastopirellula marina]
MTTSLYVRIRGHVQGPHDFDVLKRLVQRGELGRFHDVSEDREKWVKAATYAELFNPTVNYATSREGEPQVTAAVAPSSGEEVHVAPLLQEVPTWFYSTSSEEQGPISSSDVRRMLAQGTLHPWDEVWCEEMEDWAELRFVSEFSADMAGMRTTKPFLQRYGLVLALGVSFGIAMILIIASILILILRWSSPPRRESGHRKAAVLVSRETNAFFAGQAPSGSTETIIANIRSRNCDVGFCLADFGCPGSQAVTSTSRSMI